MIKDRGLEQDHSGQEREHPQEAVDVEQVDASDKTTCDKEILFI